MTVHHIIHVNIRAPAAVLETCREFYCDALGLEVGARPPFASHGYWLYADGFPVVHLVAEASGDSKRPGAHHPTVDHVAFHSTDLSATLRALRDREIPYRISTVPTLGILQVSCTDPVGVGIELSFEVDPRDPAFSAVLGTTGK